MNHHATTTDTAEKTTLTCSCDKFTAICGGGTAEERAAALELGFNDHLASVQRAGESPQLDRIEAKLDRVLELLEPDTYRVGTAIFQKLTPGGPAVCIGHTES
jgi:hypothetical protein